MQHNSRNSLEMQNNVWEVEIPFNICETDTTKQSSIVMFSG